ncbi:hypothetical protein Pmani_011788 [Petrolisthes manimaculis]|uniref:Uncharacterized protein n=1 Tax=Petrolisthes manimaculis TaxID=1843537 RepID=A0AAE1UE36_9EUCA|nr:hypothetical protein Pmani_011788 [Petrolisthes manimaculis]
MTRSRSRSSASRAKLSRELMRPKRESETTYLTKERQEKEKCRRRTSRAVENEEDSAKRRELNKQIMQKERDAETVTERISHRDSARNRMQAARESKSMVQTAQRRETDATRKQRVIASEGEQRLHNADKPWQLVCGQLEHRRVNSRLHNTGKP